MFNDFTQSQATLRDFPMLTNAMICAFSGIVNDKLQLDVFRDFPKSTTVELTYFWICLGGEINVFKSAEEGPVALLCTNRSKFYCSPWFWTCLGGRINVFKSSEEGPVSRSV